jgi:predicted DNA-binding helix-hairpin-helix protein
LKMHRVYFSAYQKGLGDESIAGEKVKLKEPKNIFVREHRLYQVDFLMRKYGFKESDIVFNKGGNLSLDCDPKQIWAQSHPEAFPVNVNRASKWELLRVPGLGPITVRQILERRTKCRINRVEDLGVKGVRQNKASKYLVF